MTEHSPTLHVRRAAVLGAGVMGAQIAAHLTQAGVPTILFDLTSDKGDPNGITLAALGRLKKLKPAPLALPQIAAAITPANYQQHLELLADCDLVIEAIAERLDWKHDLYQRVAPHLNPQVIFASNTSGISINALAEGLPDNLRNRFCGIHFFNPPRYMHLVELIPGQQTDADLLPALETFLVTTLGKGVVTAKDTPNFVGNRVGVFSMLSTMHHTEQMGLGFDVVDALTGPAIGRPKSATYRTADVVGLDTMAHVIKTMQDTLADDPWHAHFAAPKWLQSLIDNGALGQKSGAGVYQKKGREIHVLDVSQADYRLSNMQVSEAVGALLAERDPGKRLAALRASDDPQAQFLWCCLRDLFHYCAFHLEDIAHNARDVDFAIRWGYGWKQGPFEIWQSAGWAQVAQWIDEDIKAGKTMADAPLPAWVFELGNDGVHQAAGSYSAASQALQARSQLPVYQRQLSPDRVLGESSDAGTTVFETDAVRCWVNEDQEDVAVVSFKTKGNTVSLAVLEGLESAVERAEQEFAGLVIWQTREPFSYGADLSGAVDALSNGRFDEFETLVANFQRTTGRIQQSMVPVVAALRGMVLGGGCEVAMHCAHRVAALETYIGLVEAGVGLLPAGGGLKELAIAVAEHGPGDSFELLRARFETVAMAKVASSALEAKRFGLLHADDTVVFNSHEILHVALAQARALAESAYRPVAPRQQIKVHGRTGIASLKMMLVNMLEGHFISPHDFEIAERIATVLCGGDVDAGSLVNEDWLLRLEREHFVALGKTEKTQARIAHTLKTGKPLRN